MKRFDAVIFDMDGIIIDSEPLWEETEKKLLEARGIDYNTEYRGSILGLNQHDSASLLKNRFGLHESVEEIINSRLDILLKIYDKQLRLKPGINELLENLLSREIPVALASSSPARIVEYVLNKFSFNKYFKVSISGDCIEKGKPHPDIYLLAARSLMVETSACIAIEDSVNGVKSAKQAGMYCIAVPDERIDISEFQLADEIEKNTELLLRNATIRHLLN